MTTPAVTTLSERDQARFWRYVEKRDNGCLVWTGGCNQDGYGRMRVGGRKGRKRTAHDRPPKTLRRGATTAIPRSLSKGDMVTYVKELQARIEDGQAAQAEWDEAEKLLKSLARPGGSR